MYLRKDRSLDELAELGNVAQFVSFTPAPDEPRQAYVRVLGREPNLHFDSLETAISELLERSIDRSLNVRSYTPESPRSREFVYGLRDVQVVAAAVRRLNAEGLHTIVNETIDVHDGGVSGVVQGGIIEFAPDDTPRCVEKPGTASLPLDLGLRLLETVYGVPPEFGGAEGRIEFSVHPRNCGWRGTRTLLWEREDDEGEARPTLIWPNRFSRHVGDKTFGLLVAHLAGARVPFTQVLCRRLAPFSFGQKAGSGEKWVRTCPLEQEPGLYTTHRGWTDPFRLLAEEDPDGRRIAAVLVQDGVPARFSGASLEDACGRIVIEGVAGTGDGFMLGERGPEELPAGIVDEVMSTNARLREALGPVRTEWAHDGERTWIVQLHRGASVSSNTILVPGDPVDWITFPVDRGIEELRRLLSDVSPEQGVRLKGEVGMTSHIADLVRKAGVPTRLEAA